MEMSALTPKQSVSSRIPSRASVHTTKSSMLSNCRICLSSMFNPAVLTCGHKFCEACLDMFWQKIDKPDSIVCPLCRKSTHSINFVRVTSNGDTSVAPDFRKTFELENITNEEHVTTIIFKLSMIVPIIFLAAVLFKSHFWYS